MKARNEAKDSHLGESSQLSSPLRSLILQKEFTGNTKPRGNPAIAAAAILLLATAVIYILLFSLHLSRYHISRSEDASRMQKIVNLVDPWVCLTDAVNIHYESMCGRPAPGQESSLETDAVVSADDPAATHSTTSNKILRTVLPLIMNPSSEAVVVGHEAWHYNTFNDFLASKIDRCGFASKNLPNFPTSTIATISQYELRPILDDDFHHRLRRPLPFIYAGFSQRLPHRRKTSEDRLRYLEVNITDERQVRWMTFGEEEEAFKRREWLSKHVWRTATGVQTPGEFNKNRLSTFNAFAVFNDIASESKAATAKRKLARRQLYPRNDDAQEGEDDVLFLEDDAFPVYRFRDKYEIFYEQLSKAHPDWDMAWLGTCLGLHQGQYVQPGVSSHLQVVPTTRCFNAVMFKRHVAVKVMKRGSITDEYLPIDHLFNRLIEELHLKVVWAVPPLFFEGSKALDVIPC